MLVSLKSERGVGHLLVIIPAVCVLAVIISANIPITRQLSDNGGAVQGVSFGSNTGVGATGSKPTSTAPVETRTVTPTSEVVNQPFKKVDPKGIEVKNQVGEVRNDKTESWEDKREKRGEKKEAREIESEKWKELKIEKKVRVTSEGPAKAVVQGVSGAVSTMPVKVDSNTGEVQVTTPKGTKTVTVLPEDAIDRLKASKILDDVESGKKEGDLASVNQLVKLEEKDGKLKYEIRGERKNKIFGFIPVKTSVTAFVSADNGAITETKESLFAKFIKRISF